MIVLYKAPERPSPREPNKLTPSLVYPFVGIAEDRMFRRAQDGCVACWSPTDTGLGLLGDDEWCADALTAMGVPLAEAAALVEYERGRSLRPAVTGRIPTGDIKVPVRVCSACAARAGLRTMFISPDKPLLVHAAEPRCAVDIPSA